MADRVAQCFCPLPPSVGLERAVNWLIQHGYQLSARTGYEAQLFHPGGVSPEPPGHRLLVRASNERLEFTYQPASVFDAMPSPLEEERFERLLDDLTASLTGAPKSAQHVAEKQRPPAAFCPECGRRSEPGETVCALCGAAL